MRTEPVEIPDQVLAVVIAESLAAEPKECCGWLSGPASEAIVDTARPCVNRQSVDHPTSPDRGSETAYVIGGRDLLELESSLESLSPAKVIYHSHPNGRAYLSETDKTVATSPWGGGPTYPVQQLVVGVLNGVALEAALFGWEPNLGDYVELRRWDRNDLASLAEH